MDLLLLIPYYNDRAGLLKTLRSIECTRGAECLVIDDGSHETLREEDVRAAIKDNIRLTVLRKERNAGIVEALNTGFNFIINNRPECKFIARIDCGDQCIGQRLDKQVAFLEANVEYGIVGSWAEFVDRSGKLKFRVTPPANDPDIRNEMNRRVGFMHPSVMYRSEVLAKSGLYPNGYSHAEDYAYFFKVLEFFKGANLEEYLTVIEFRSDGVSISNRTKQLISRIRVIFDHAGLSVKSSIGILITTLLLVTPVSVVNFTKARMM